MFKKKKKVESATGYLGDLDDKQQQCLDKFKAHLLKKGNLGLDNPWFTDQYLLRFCRARKFDVAKTVKMWEDFIAERATNKVDDLCANFVYDELPQVVEVYTRGYYGVDRFGHPVYYDFSGKINPDEVLKVTTEERFFQYIYADYERCLKFRLLAMSHLT
jgi:hypothetical protein